MIAKLYRFAALLLLAFGLPACATITTGTTQTISVLTEPPGAACTMTRDGTIMGVVNPTPGTVSLSKSSRDIAIRCTRAGNLPGVQTITPQFQGMTAGNILLGGFIGLAVDAASGAMSRYPENVIVSLPPETFASEGSREAFFTTRIADTRRLFDERLTAARSACGTDTQACETRIQALNRERDDELALLERQRTTARVSP
ncbi:hypothetical protein [Falsiroseomonas sp.]|uniref:hypothetical protein n=1 Tax=Falsiroseomonas sp. TaxID=2870721 RepID=UPI003F71C364